MCVEERTIIFFDHVVPENESRPHNSGALVRKERATYVPSLFQDLVHF